MKNKLLKLVNDRGGATILVAMIVISAVILVIALSLGLSSISQNQINIYQSKSSRVLLNVDGCAEEALIRLNSNNVYSGETFYVEDTTCVISVNGSGATRTLSVTAENDIYSRNLQINVTIFPMFSVTSWEETL